LVRPYSCVVGPLRLDLTGRSGFAVKVAPIMVPSYVRKASLRCGADSAAADRSTVAKNDGTDPTSDCA
jgi:hypothetical protein